MIVGSICILTICYGIAGGVRLWKRQSKYDAFLLFLFCGFIAGYFIPGIGNAWPTVENIYSFLYERVAKYMFENVLNIKLEAFR
ncbi:hypothetical protein [Cohnella luojiensis]|uniref:Uncharacterized protein n=1 Tax=Cohnella luojiensis TaxID=652876 RepID=A0A4Y8M6Z8_9BACL|nr:hypothetical protein [Cohnella luojiensis]TFE28594.1 hypothetical protein E2980_07125 [Cohnella luojiensis]